MEETQREAIRAFAHGYAAGWWNRDERRTNQKDVQRVEPEQIVEAMFRWVDDEGVGASYAPFSEVLKEMRLAAEAATGQDLEQLE